MAGNVVTVRNLLAASAFAGYGIWMYFAGSLGWRHLGLLALMWCCVAPQDGPRRFMRDWWPMVLFWFSYDVMRIFSSSLYSRVAVEQPFRWESRFFLSPDGTIWPFYFARWAALHASKPGVRILDAFCNLVYLTQLFGIPATMLALWSRDKTLLFRRLVWSLTALHAMTLLIYVGYPAAPPWWVYQNGFLKPAPGNSMPAGLKEGTILSTLFHLSPNRFAAIPSLHGAYPLLLTLVLALHGAAARWVVLSGIYAASMWFACVYLNQHYIIDLLIGSALVFAALPFANKRNL
jgi:hypothetical protein